MELKLYQVMWLPVGIGIADAIYRFTTGDYYIAMWAAIAAFAFQQVIHAYQLVDELWHDNESLAEILRQVQEDNKNG